MRMKLFCQILWLVILACISWAVPTVAKTAAAPVSTTAVAPVDQAGNPSLFDDDEPTARDQALPERPKGKMPFVPDGNSREYILGTGDEIKLVVYGEDDLSGQYLVGSTGIVALPLIGNIDAAGHTIHEFENLIRVKLSKGYLKDPRVSVAVANYRPFFILGEVMKPGSYPYINGMSVLNAVALAGGYTYRADHSDVKIVHANDPQKTEQNITEDAVIMPGDIIRVSERFF